MKRLKLIALALFLSCGLRSFSQTGTGTIYIIQQPCNGNGVLAVSITSGLSLPITYYYYSSDGSSATHSGIYSLNDTLYGISSPVNYIYATDGTGAYYTNSSVGMIPPFSLDPAVITDAVCPGLTGTINLTINGGTTPSSVQWFQSVPFGPIGPFAGSGDPVTLPPGSYSAIITDASGCTIYTGTDSSIVFNIQNISGITFSVPTTIASCTNGTATITGISGGMSPYTYLWDNGASTSSISGLSEGYYNATVTDAQGCHQDASGYVYQSISITANPVVTAATCLQNDGSVITFGSGGMPPYTYIYSNGYAGQTATGLAGGTYLNVTATDANGCIGTNYTYINSSTPISVTYSSTTSLCTSPTGTATLTIAGGTGPYTVDWVTPTPMSGVTATNLPPGTYPFTVHDAVGCVQTGTVLVAPVSTLTAGAYSANPVCPATTGNVYTTVTGSAPPFSYLWNTGSTLSSLTSVPTGNYSVVITDNMGCSLTKYAYVVPSSPITIGLSTTPASCMYAADGSVSSTVLGGTPPYNYYWSNGQTTPTATGLTSGNYALAVQDVNGCSQDTWGYFTHVGYDPTNTSCYCTITGKVYVDANSNCIMDSGEQGIEHVMIHCAGFGYTFTDVNGDYFFYVPSGSYTLSESVQYAYPLSPCQSNSIPVTAVATTGCVNTVNFANNVNTIHDIHITRTNMDGAVPGTNHMQALLVRNDGTVNESNIQFGYKNDGQLSFTGSSPITYSQIDPVGEPNWYSVNSGFPAMAPGASMALYNNYFVPTYVPLATSVVMSDTTAYTSPMSNWLIDFTPWNNVEQFNETVVGSFDPNFKEVSPKGNGPQGFITTADSSLDYTIHFQNTGSYYANKVVVVDTLDSDLDWTSIRLGYADHLYSATVSESGVLTFTFDNIHLLWKDANDMASRGMVSYSIKQKPALAIGTQIKNSAAIYFDYNAPVITNQTLNTIALPMGIAEQKPASDLLIYPNPADQVLTINLEKVKDAVTVGIYDLQGRMITNENVNTPQQKINVSGLVNGLYFVVVETSSGQTITKKFIKN